MMARHAAGPLVRASHHGETVTYTAPDAAGDVTAVVDRLDVEPLDGAAQVARRTAIVFLPTSELPVSSVEPGHTLRLPMRIGETAVACRITRIISQDEGGYLVEVRE